MPTLEAPSNATATSPMLQQTRFIRASRARVYEAWTNPEIFKQWFGSAGMYCPSAALDVREGGSYRVDIAPRAEAGTAASSESAGGGAALTGTYTRIVPNELLEFTWIPPWAPGENSVVTVSLRDVEGGTELILRHENFLNEASRDAHNKGWTDGLDKLTSTVQQ